MSVHRWKWDKPIRWANLARAGRIFYGLRDHQIRKLLDKAIDEGRARKLPGRGLYQLTEAGLIPLVDERDEPAQLIHIEG